MFNLNLILVLTVPTITEIYKYSINAKYNAILNAHKSTQITNILLFELIFLWFYFNKFFYQNTSIRYFFYFYFIILIIFNYFFKKLTQTTINLVVLFTLLVLLNFNTWNLIPFIFTAELISISTFFVLFFQNTTVIFEKKFNIVYFLITNILIFFFGIVSSVLMLQNIGSCNIDIIVLFFKLSDFTWIKFVLFLYFLLKMGQGPVVFFKFRFYRLTNIADLVYYLYVYSVLIWPILLLVFSKIFVTYTIIYLILCLGLVTFALLQSFFIYTSFIDFLVFSTWTFSWYVLIFVLLLC